MFKSDSAQAEWKYLNCGYIHKGKAAPKVCPSWAKPQGYFRQLDFVR